MQQYDITAIVNLHHEGLLAHFSLLSLAKAKAFAEQQGLTVEVIVVLDHPNPATLEYAQSCDILRFVPIHVAYHDLGRARNSGVRAANGEWIGFLDGDDLWAENWLAAAYFAGRKDERQVVLHPRASIYFEEENSLWVHVDMEDEDFDIFGLFFSNYWTASSFAKRELYKTFPYPDTDLNKQIGYEDWGWNLRTVAEGCIHKCVPDTVHAIRRKTDSLLQLARRRMALPEAHNVLRTMLSNGCILGKLIASSEARSPSI